QLVSIGGKSIPLNRHRSLEDQYLNSKNVTYDSKGNALLAGYHFTLFKEDGSHHTFSLPYYCDNILEDEEGYYWALVRNNDVIKMQLKDGMLELVKKWNLAKLNPRYSILWKPNVLAVGTRHQGLVFLTEGKGELKETG